MEEIRYWVTEDGEKFDNESAACRHEELLNFQKVQNDVICLDFNCEPVNPMVPDSAYFLNLRTQKAFDWWKNYTYDAGYITDGVESPGLYAYNEQTYEWDVLDGVISKLMDAKKTLEGA